MISENPWIPAYAGMTDGTLVRVSLLQTPPSGGVCIFVARFLFQS